MCVSLDYKLTYCIVLDLYNTGSNCTPAIYSSGDLHSTIITYRCYAANHEFSFLFGIVPYVSMRAVHLYDMAWNVISRHCLSIMSNSALSSNLGFKSKKYFLIHFLHPNMIFSKTSDCLLQLSSLAIYLNHYEMTGVNLSPHLYWKHINELIFYFAFFRVHLITF